MSVNSTAREPLAFSRAAVVSLLLAVGAATFLALWPCFHAGERVTGKVQRVGDTGGSPSVARVCSSLIEVEGVGVLGVLLLPVVMAGVGVLASRLRWRAVAWLVAVLLFVFCVLAGFSVGLFSGAV